MTILNIHGFGGSPYNSAYSALQANNYTDIISPSIDYNAETPENIMAKLRNIIADNGIDLIVGTSLGGFFGAVLSAEKNIPVILVNPCLPAVSSSAKAWILRRYKAICFYIRYACKAGQQQC